MATEGLTLRNPFEGGHAPSEVQLKQYEKAYRELKTEIITEDKEFSAKQTHKLKGSLESLRDIATKAVSNRQECEVKIVHLKKQSKIYEQKISEYNRVFKSTNHEKEFRDKIASHEQQHIANCKRRIEIAKSLDVASFKKLEIEERKSEAHEVFKWIMVALYLEPENKYYWPNFKEQAIETDKGTDLVERLGKIDALHAKEEQRVKSVKFLEQFDSVKKSNELKSYEKEVNGIQEIAKLFLNSSQIGRSIKELEKEIEKNRAFSSKGDEENVQNIDSNRAIHQRIKVSEAYISQLNAMQKLLNNKLERYNQQINLGEGYVTELGKISSYVQDYKPPVDSNQKRDNCECAIY